MVRKTSTLLHELFQNGRFAGLGVAQATYIMRKKMMKRAVLSILVSSMFAGPVLVLADNQISSPGYTLEFTTVSFTELDREGFHSESFQFDFHEGTEQSKTRQSFKIGNNLYSVVGETSKHAIKDFKKLLDTFYKNWNKLEDVEVTSKIEHTKTTPGFTFRTTSATYMVAGVPRQPDSDTFNFNLSNNVENPTVQREIKLGAVNYKVIGKIKKRSIKVLKKHLDILYKNWDDLKEPYSAESYNNKIQKALEDGPAIDHEKLDAAEIAQRYTDKIFKTLGVGTPIKEHVRTSLTITPIKESFGDHQTYKVVVRRSKSGESITTFKKVRKDPYEFNFHGKLTSLHIKVFRESVIKELKKARKKRSRPKESMGSNKKTEFRGIMLSRSLNFDAGTESITVSHPSGGGVTSTQSPHVTIGPVWSGWHLDSRDDATLSDVDDMLEILEQIEAILIEEAFDDPPSDD